MVEPEVAFLELDGLLDLAEAYITHIVTTVLAHHRADLKVIGKDVTKLEAVIAPSSSPSNDVILSAALSERNESKGEVEGPAVASNSSAPKDASSRPDPEQAKRVEGGVEDLLFPLPPPTNSPASPTTKPTPCSKKPTPKEKSKPPTNTATTSALPTKPTSAANSRSQS